MNPSLLSPPPCLPDPFSDRPFFFCDDCAAQNFTLSHTAATSFSSTFHRHFPFPSWIARTPEYFPRLSLDSIGSFPFCHYDSFSFASKATFGLVTVIEVFLVILLSLADLINYTGFDPSPECCFYVVPPVVFYYI